MTGRYLIAASTLSSVIVGTHINAQSPPTPPPTFTSPVALKLQMREIWSDRVFWTRAYLIAALNGAPDADVAADRLVKTDDDLALTIGPFCGERTSQSLRQALHDQSSTVKSLPAAAKRSAGTIGTSASDTSNMGPLLERWYHGREAIGAALQGCNINGSSSGLPDLLQRYLSATMKELQARVNGDWAADVKAFDEARHSALRVADDVSDRIAATYLGRFTGSIGTSVVR